MNSGGKTASLPKLKDLCLEDKLRVKQLIEDLARAGTGPLECVALCTCLARSLHFFKYTEKEVMEEQLEMERRKFSGKLLALQQHQAILMREKKNILATLAV